MAAAKKKAKTSTSAPDMSGAFQPTVRVFTTWTPDLIRSADLQADAGYLRPAANICDWLLSDDRVRSTIFTRANALLGLDPDFERSGDKRRSGRAVKALEVGEDWWEAYPESTLFELVIWGLLLGVKPARHYWERKEDHGGRVLPMPQGWHPQHLRFDNPSRTWRVRVSTETYGGETEEVLTPGDGEWILHMPFGPNRPWSMGLWRCLAPLVLLKQYARQDWASVSEKGILLVLTCLNAAAADEIDGYTKDARKQLATDIYSRGKQGVAALPPGIDLKAVQAAINSKDVQGALIEMADKAITIAIRGGNLTTDVSQGGSRAATETQASMGDAGNLRFDAQSLTTTVHDQSLTWWAQFNYGDSALAPWPVYPVEEEEDLGAKVETEEKAFETVDNAERLGFDVDRQAFLDDHKITWAKPGERPKPVAPTTTPGTQPDPAKPAGGPNAPAAPATDPNADPNAPPPKGEPQARAVSLASRASTKKNSGFVSGQLYADDVADASSKQASGLMSEMLREIGAIIDEAADYPELRKRILAYYKDRAPAEDLADLVEKAMVLAQFGGAAAVRTDVPQVEK